MNKKIEDQDVADAIELTVMCQEFNCLPGVGGLLDQDSYYVWQMQLVKNAQTERSELDRKKLEKKHK